MSKLAEHYKQLYDDGLWSIKRMRDAVAKGKISTDEFVWIAGEDY